MYITAGTAALFDLPLDKAFEEVHRSNMTKNKNALNKTGDKGKDENYQPPNIEKILETYRKI